MAKSKGDKSIQNRHIYSRVSYLYQAAHILASHSQTSPKDSEDDTLKTQEQEHKAESNLSRQLLSNMRAVSLKAVIRQSPAMKQAVCKFCDTAQIEGETCHSVVENLSKGGRKPWADVLVVRCLTCKNAKRYPVHAPKQKRKHLRVVAVEGSKTLVMQKADEG